MLSGSSQTMLSAVFVDYDNIYLSLRRKNERAAKRFAKNTHKWISAIQSGELIKPTQPNEPQLPRRLVMNRCYGNPVPRKNQNDNATDMNSFPFVRNHFIRSGFEIIDCPPLTAQLKNSSDIKMVMDLRDFLTHDTYFHEFIILSSDADFTPVLHRLRAHGRRTVIFSNDNSAAAYTALADGAVVETDLIEFLLDSEIAEEAADSTTSEYLPARTAIIDEVVKMVREASAPLPLETLAERATRLLGHEKTAGSNWGGAGGFLELLKSDLPDSVRLTDSSPYYAYDVRRVVQNTERRSLPPVTTEPTPVSSPIFSAPVSQRPAPEQVHTPVATTTPSPQPAPAPAGGSTAAARPIAAQTTIQAPEGDPQSAEIQRSITRILEASKVPAIWWKDYRAIFEELSAEIRQNQLQGVQTIANVVQRLQLRNVKVRNEDIRFILDVVSEPDPWFEKEVSANIFAGRFRNFVVNRCRSHGLSLTRQELDLIEVWFAAANVDVIKQPAGTGGSTDPGVRSASAAEPSRGTMQGGASDEDGPSYGDMSDFEDMPRIMRS